MPARRVIVQGVSTYYLDEGEGPVVLLVHGNASSARDWWPFAESLATTNRVVAVSLPGYGETSPVGDLRPDRFVSFIAAFLDVLGIDSVMAVGHSYGGLLVAELALAHPERVTRLAMLDSAGLGRAVNPLLVAESFIPVPVAEVLITALLLPGGSVLRVLGGALQLQRPWRLPKSFWVRQLRLSHSRTFLQTSFDAVRIGVGLRGQRFDVHKRLGEIDVPALVIWGVSDQLFPVWQGVLAAKKLPHGRFGLIIAASHVSFIDSPAEVMNFLGPFLRDDLAVVEDAAPAQ
ncbi:alpha/beta fold hydrolase [Actinomadura rayongensis]|uniref:Alpha/beta fold hydrolase n=1 Tax=Actinomadura rayongensis TaxID=1429076 RepID=A0A6I4WAF4_9ACTN|nr:alpha/beta hydrolase [Actinomadura rayongensis]MXQ65730.1 alpha/beta fold hydrolase [Actinomadura rayongensis]